MMCRRIAAAWATWRPRHGGKLGPGPAFREAIEAALAVQPIDPLIAALEEIRSQATGHKISTAYNEGVNIALDNIQRIATQALKGYS